VTPVDREQRDTFCYSIAAETLPVADRKTYHDIANILAIVLPSRTLGVIAAAGGHIQFMYFIQF